MELDSRTPTVAGPATSRLEAFLDYNKFLDCVHCGFCLQACPTYLELGTEMDSPRGRIYLMRALSDQTLDLTRDVTRHLDLCLGCRACESACPSGVQYGQLIEAARCFVEQSHQRTLPERWHRRAIRWVFPHPQRLRALLAPARLAQRIGIWPLIARWLPMAATISPRARTTPLPEVFPAVGQERARVGLLTGCVAQVLFDETNQATARVLARNGCTVVVPSAQSCCGALSLHNGSLEEALDFARRTITAFPQDLEVIVVNAAGCGAMLKQYGELLKGDPAFADRARRFSAKVRDVSEWLATLPIETPPAIAKVSVAYHDACHLAHGQQVREQPRALLRAIPGLELVELPESELCCGSAGSYNLVEPVMAARLRERKIDNIERANAECVAAGNPGCILQIRAGLQKRGLTLPVLHPIEILDRVYRGEPLAG